MEHVLIPQWIINGLYALGLICAWVAVLIITDERKRKKIVSETIDIAISREEKLQLLRKMLKKNMCLKTSKLGFFCTEEKGHSGNHKAQNYFSFRVLDEWSNDNADKQGTKLEN
jgi:hypothetical protein